MTLRIDGTIVALDPADPERVRKGTVWLGEKGLVDAVTGAGEPAPAGFSAAHAVNVGDAWVFPGVIDLHNHIAYDTLPLWTEPTQKKPFLHHKDWTGKPSYQPDISWPAWILATCEPEALLAYVQVKALVGGTTCIQGWPGSNRSGGLMVRSADDESFGTTDRNLIYTSALTATPEMLHARHATLAAGRGFIYHCAEGQKGSVVTGEYDDVEHQGCLLERLMAVHCTAVADFSSWRPHAGAVVWSPFSNLWLYGQTTDVKAARAAGLKICLGSDWGPSGTKHVLGELKVAAILNERDSLGLGDRDLVEAVTANPGDMLGRCWPHPAGRIRAGAVGDLTVIARRGTDPWKDLITARERDVVLVIVGGVPRYGQPAPMSGAGASPVGAITVAGQARTISIPDPESPGKQWPWATIEKRLDEVRKDPAGAIAAAKKRAERGAGPGAGPAPLAIALDMPFGEGPTAGPPPEPAKVVIPALDALTHDQAFLRSLHGRGFHGGVLDGLGRYYG
jgi:5-methylthioadenosine/S-adenosylhomocysteine deaminase